MGSAPEFHTSFAFYEFPSVKNTCNLHLSFRAREGYHYCSFSHYVYILAIKLHFVRPATSPTILILIQVLQQRISPRLKYLSNVKEHVQNLKCAY